jgi:hypothetical protein
MKDVQQLLQDMLESIRAIYRPNANNSPIFS